MPRPGAVPAVLIDGPSAGQVIYTDPEVSGWYTAKPMAPIEYSPSRDLANWLLPAPTMYRFQWRTAPLVVGGSAEPEWFRLRFGWSEHGEPDEDAIRHHGRTALLEHPELMPAGAILWPSDPADDRPIRILTQGDGPHPGCRDEFQMEQGTGLLRGVCPVCGWRTELVESRRFEELRALTMLHGQAGQAALRELLERGLYSYADYAALMGILGSANRPREAPGAIPEARQGSAAMGEVPTAFADWPEQGSTCAHVCGADPDHQCQAGASVHLTYALPSGGTRSMPMCGPCYQSETAAKETADA